MFRSTRNSGRGGCATSARQARAATSRIGCLVPPVPSAISARANCSWTSCRTPLARHFLQGTRYSNLLTIRVSGDRFEKKQWKPFLFNGRLASALGAWPWSDVFNSSETANLLLSTLSGSIVGVGDAIGEFDRTNLLRVVRADGVIIKPDDP